MTRNTVSIAVAILLLAACGDGAVSRDAPPAAAVMLTSQEADPLEDQLEALDAELTAILAGEFDAEATDRLLRAEAITDRLMQARRNVDWLGTGYDIEARLRQLQAMADRIVARMLRGGQQQELRNDLRLLHASVRELRETLARVGGGPRPPSLDTLIARYNRALLERGRRPIVPAQAADEAPETLPDDEPVPAAPGAPLGTPADDDGGA